MLLAVIMGLEQPRRSVLSKRRWRRRLLLVSFCRMIVFTRNLSGGPVLEKAVTPLDAGNHEGFRVSPSFHAARADDFACLRPSQPIFNGAGMGWAPGEPSTQGVVMEAVSEKFAAVPVGEATVWNNWNFCS